MLSLDETKKYLRVDSDDEDQLIQGFIESADTIVSDVCRDSGDSEESGPVKNAAKLYVVAYLYEHREKADYLDLMLTLRALLFGVREDKF